MRLRSLLLLSATAVAFAGPSRSAAEPVSFVEAAINGTSGIEGMRRARASASSPDGVFLYVATSWDDSIVILERDAIDGALGFLGRVTWTGATTVSPGTVPDLGQPRGLAVSPDGADLYVTAANRDSPAAIVTFDRNLATGALTFSGSLVDQVDVDGIESAESILVSADGANVYVPGFEHHTVVSFSRNASTGALTQIDLEQDGVGGVDGLEAPKRISESPDGAYLYVASQSRPTVTAGFGGVTVFARDGAGALSFVEFQQQGTGGVDGLWAPYDVVVSPDGLHVYTANYGRGSEVPPKPGGLAIFARNPADGRLSFVDSYTDAELGVEHATGIATSADGALVFLSAQGAFGPYDGSLLVFRRNSVSGALTLIQRFDDNVEGVDGLAGPLSLHVPLDGANVYVSSEQEPVGNDLRGAVAVFAVPEPGAAATAAVLTLAGLAVRSRAARPSGRRRGTS